MGLHDSGLIGNGCDVSFVVLMVDVCWQVQSNVSFIWVIMCFG